MKILYKIPCNLKGGVKIVDNAEMELNIDGSIVKLDLAIREVSVNPDAMYPNLEFHISLQLSQSQSPQGHLYLTNIYAIVKILDNRQHIVGRASTDKPFIEIQSQESMLTLSLDMDHLRLKHIERLRGGGDAKFQLILNGAIISHPSRRTLTVTALPHDHLLNYRIAKSDWVEQYLKNLHFKDVWLLEVPTLEAPVGDMKVALEHLQTAWKKFEMGEYDCGAYQVPQVP